MSEAESPKRDTSQDVSRHWPSTIEAAARTGLSKRQLLKLKAEGVLVSGKDPHRVERWDPELLALARVATDDDDEGDAPGASESSLNGQALVLLRQAQGHTESAFKLVLDPMRQLLKAREEDVEALRARVKHLEAQLDGAFELREKMLSEQHIRDMLASDAQRANQRKDRALQLVESHAPKLLAAISPAATAVVDLMRSLNPEQRGILLETEFLTPEQKRQVITVLEAAPAVAPPAPAAEPEKKDEPAA
jgi:hypothetical protein